MPQFTKWYGPGVVGFMNATATRRVDWASDTIKVALFTSSYTPDQDNDTFFNTLTGEVSSGGGYTSGGKALTGKAIVVDKQNRQVRLDAADVFWPNSTITARYAVIYKDTGTPATSPVIGYVDFSSNRSTTSQPFVVAWQQDGALRLVYTNAKRTPSIFVSATGNDANDGLTPTTPKTLTGVMGTGGAGGTANPNDVVCLLSAGGDYTFSGSPGWTPGRDGTEAGGYITLRGGWDGRPTIRSSAVGTTSGGVVQLKTGTPWNGSRYLAFDGITFDGQDKHGSAFSTKDGCHHIQLVDCRAQRGGGAGFALNAGDYITVFRCDAWLNGYNQGFSSGFSLWNMAASGSGTLASAGTYDNFYDRRPGFHNFFVACRSAGTRDAGGTPSDGNGWLFDGRNNVPDFLMAHCLAYMNSGRGFGVLAVTPTMGLILNCTSYKNTLRQVSSAYPEFQIQSKNDGAGLNSNCDNIKLANCISQAWTPAGLAGTLTRHQYQHSVVGASSINNPEYAKCIGTGGSGTGSLPGSVTSDVNQYKSADPLFTNPPTVATNAYDQEINAPAPWTLTNEFKLQGGSPALAWGVDAASQSYWSVEHYKDGYRWIYRTVESDVNRTLGVSFDAGCYQQ